MKICLLEPAYDVGIFVNWSIKFIGDRKFCKSVKVARI